MARLTSFLQYDDEKKKIVVDYSCWLDAGETLSNVTPTITPVTVPPLVTTGGFMSVDLLSYAVFISGGLAGTIYKVELLALTSIGQKKHDDVTVQVTE